MGAPVIDAETALIGALVTLWLIITLGGVGARYLQRRRLVRLLHQSTAPLVDAPPFHPLAVFVEGALDDRVVHEVVASTLTPVPAGAQGVWDTADIVAVPLPYPGRVVYRLGGAWAEGDLLRLPPERTPLRRCVEAAAAESSAWRTWLDAHAAKS